MSPTYSREPGFFRLMKALAEYNSIWPYDPFLSSVYKAYQQYRQRRLSEDQIDWVRKRLQEVDLSWLRRYASSFSRIALAVEALLDHSSLPATQRKMIRSFKKAMLVGKVLSPKQVALIERYAATYGGAPCLGNRSEGVHRNDPTAMGDGEENAHGK